MKTRDVRVPLFPFRPLFTRSNVILALIGFITRKPWGNGGAAVWAFPSRLFLPIFSVLVPETDSVKYILSTV